MGDVWIVFSPIISLLSLFLGDDPIQVGKLSQRAVKPKQPTGDQISVERSSGTFVTYGDISCFSF